MSRSKRVRLVMEGLASEEGHVRLPDFLAQLRRLNSSLVRADRLESGGRSIYFRVVELSHSSPATVALEPCPFDAREDYTGRVVETYSSILEALDVGRDLPDHTDTKLLLALKEMTNPVLKSLSRVQIQANSVTANLDHDFRRNIGAALEQSETFPGTIRGMLDAINVHGSTNVFYIYPEFGPQKVRCVFGSDQIELAKEGIGQFVEVSGTFSYKRAAKYPHAAKVEKIEIFPPEDELPTLLDIRGIVSRFSETASG